jgi:hypothetical protein
MLMRFRRFVRFLSVVSVLFWVYRARHTLAGLIPFARTVPTRVRMGRGKELGLATTVHWALLRDPRLKGADIRVGSIEGSTVVLCAPSSESRANLAREIVASLPGVRDVQLQDPATPLQPEPAAVRLAG